MIIKYDKDGNQQVFENSKVVEIITKDGDIFYLHTLLKYDPFKLEELKKHNYLYFSNVDNIRCSDIVSIRILGSYVMTDNRKLLKPLRLRDVRNGLTFYNEIAYM